MNENDYNNTYKPAEPTPPENHKTNIGIIAVICCIILALSVSGAAVYITYSNNKKAEEAAAVQKAENATKRINELIDDIYQVSDSYDSSYDIAKDKLTEIEQLINENNITGALAAKYNSASTYLKDLKTYDEIMEVGYSDDYSDISRASQLIGQLTDEKVIRKVEQSDITSNFEEFVQKSILARAFYKAQQYVLNKYPGSYIYSTYYHDKKTFQLGYDVPGTDRTLESEKDTNFDYADSVLFGSDEILSKINSNGGYAILVRYQDNSMMRIWWCVGADIKAKIDNGALRFDIIRYSNGKSESSNNLTLDQALNFNIINPS